MSALGRGQTSRQIRVMSIMPLLDEQIVQKFFPMVGSISNPGIGIGLLVSKTAGVGMPMLV
jgi:hypothetical protein